MKRIFWSRGAKAVYAIVGLTFVALAGWVAYRINFPDAGMQTPAGETISFYEHSGDRPSLILFWATWCPSCRKLMPELATLQASLPEGSVNFYALNVSEDGDPVAYFKEHGYRFHLLLNADDVEDLYGTFGTPRLILVDGSKIVRYTLKATTSQEELMNDLRASLAAPAT
jgi:cytochrome c biogenesis protein CcmG/thiol:disulfide interchange protein DsbE